MTEEQFEEIFENTDSDLGSVDGDNCYLGLQIMSKYVKNLVHGADHDIMYGPDVRELVEAGITEEDVTMLSKLNWMINDSEYVACFV
jgi:hypothetical protein